jgi:hypothetical protein
VVARARRSPVALAFILRDRRYATISLSLAAAATIAGTGVAAPVAHTAAKLVTGRGIKDGAVTSTKIRDHSLTRNDLARGVLPAGAAGAPGAAGASGAAGAPGTPTGAGPLGQPGTAAVNAPFVDGSGAGP